MRMSLGLLVATLSFELLLGFNAHALELDWSGQFWSEFHFVTGYGSASNQNTSFESVFLRLKPKVVVNDNIYIKSEWWVGDPIFGFFGSSTPYSFDQRQFYSSQSRGFSLTAQRIWGEFLTDWGTFQVGRVPLSWGLGLVWNSGDNLWDRYMSTGDAVRLLAKFGSFSVVASLIVNSAGNSIGSACTVSGGVCNPGLGSGGVADYSLIFKYENIEEELEIGANIIKRIAAGKQDPDSGMLTPPQPLGSRSAGAMNYVTYDLYARKKFNRFSLGVEVPIASGNVGASSYQTVALASELDYKPSDSLSLALRAGYAPGQNSSDNATIDTFRAFYFNPNYHIGMVMFNYQLSNFAGAQTLNSPNLNPNNLASPYDNPIVNAVYVAVSSQIKPWDKWTLRPAIIYARAPQGASNGKYSYNYLTKTFQLNSTGADQDLSLGWEADLGVTFQWDENFQFTWDNGLFFPGGFYAFSNTTSLNSTAPVFATSLKVGVSF